MPLDPTVPSFPFPSARNHSPTISSASNTSNTLTASSHFTSSALDTPQSCDSSLPSQSEDIHHVIKRKKAVSFHPSGETEPFLPSGFGKGWMSSTPSRLAEEDAWLKANSPERTRSPSMPNLPSQADRWGPDELVHGLSQLRLSQVDHQEFYSPHSALAHQASHASLRQPYIAASNAQCTAYPGREAVCLPYQRALIHHQSFPDLSPRGRIGWSPHHASQDLEEVESTCAGGLGKRSRSMSFVAWTGQRRNVWIPNIVATWTEEYVKELASDYGHVLSVKVGHRDIRDGSSVDCPIPSQFCRSHAFVLFQHPAEAAEFILAVKASGAHCEYAREDFQTEWKSREDPNSSNLYVQGLSMEDNEEDIVRLFAAFGRVVTMKILVDDQGRRRGPVLARLQSRPQAEDAIRGLHGRFYARSGETLQVRVADSDQQKNLKKRASYQGKSAVIGPTTQPWISEFEKLGDQRALHYRALLEDELRKVDSTLGPRIRTPSYRQVTDALPAALHRHTSQPRLYPSYAHGSAQAASVSGPPPPGLWPPPTSTSQAHLLSSLHHARSSPELGGLISPRP